MPHMKYFQGLTDIHKHYQNIEFYSGESWGETLLQSRGIDPKDQDLIKDPKQESEAVRFLIGCQHAIGHDEISE